MMQLKYLFQLTRTLDSENFYELLNRAKAKSKGEYLLHSGDDKYVDDALASKGITIAYHDYSKKKIKLTVDPNWILDDDEPDHDTIAKSVRKLETYIGDYFKSKYELNDFKLSKMRLIMDIDAHKRRNVAAYLKVLKKIGKVKGFSPSCDSRLDKDMYFCLEGNSNGIEFMIYDLEKLAKDQLLEADAKPKKLKSIAEKMEGILRTEVWLKVPKITRGFTIGTVASEQITGLLENSKKIFLEIFMRIIPFGDFYKKSKAVEIIAREVTDRRLRRKMLRLLALVPERKSLLLAQKALGCRRIDDVMEMFFSIEVSPVTISKRHDFDKLVNLYKYL
ncbi:MAG: hypothetical protein FWG88_11955 [Oscillospiraceae bacterium]|nr:hypothetical protein [Oscillospiraceae bacterium]